MNQSSVSRTAHPPLKMLPFLGATHNAFSTSPRNFWVYDPENYRFSDMFTRSTQVHHNQGYWTTATKNFRAFRNCNAERTYVAVGWGGNDVVKKCHSSSEAFGLYLKMWLMNCV